MNEVENGDLDRMAFECVRLLASEFENGSLRPPLKAVSNLYPAATIDQSIEVEVKRGESLDAFSERVGPLIAALAVRLRESRLRRFEYPSGLSLPVFVNVVDKPGRAALLAIPHFDVEHGQQKLVIRCRGWEVLR